MTAKEYKKSRYFIMKCNPVSWQKRMVSNKRYRARTRERWVEYNRDYYSNHKEKWIEYKANRKANASINN